MDCRKFVLVAAVMAGCCMEMAAQTDAGLSESYAKRYNLIVSKLGYDGVGVETVLTQWEKADSLNTDMLTAWFNYWFTKAQSEEVVVKTQKRYLGAEPLLSLKDSTGADIYYFQEVFYDDGMFSKAMKYLDKAISEEPLRLDLRFTKVASLMSYEKDSPDMALSYLLALADRNAGGDCMGISRLRDFGRLLYAGDAGVLFRFLQARHSFFVQCVQDPVGKDASR